MQPSDPMYYPVYLDLRDRPCFVIGGCAMAEEKVKGLVAAGARVTVISPDLTPALSRLVVEGSPTHYGQSPQDQRGTGWPVPSPARHSFPGLGLAPLPGIPRCCGVRSGPTPTTRARSVPGDESSG